MKKSIYLLAVFVAVFFVSCQKEAEKQVEPVAEPAGTTLRAAVNEGVDTKVSANPVGVFAWQASDKIAVLDDSGYAYEFTASGTGASSEFTCASSITLGAYAQYPYSASFAGLGDELDFQIPATITYSADATNMPMLGKISGDVATFKAVGGLLKLIVYGVPADATELEFAAKNKKISGGFEIADASVDAPVIVTAAKGTGDNLITIDFTGKRSDNMVFYIPLPTGTIDGFDLTFNDTDVTSISSSKNLSIARNDIIVAPAINKLTPETMWSETFTNYAADTKFSNSDIHTGTGYDAVAYEGASIKYTTTDGNSDTKLYAANNAGGTSPELLINKKKDSSTFGSFTVAGIPTKGSKYLSLEFKATGNSLTLESVEDSGVSIYGSYDASNNYTGSIINENESSSITLIFTNKSSSNVRIDDIIVKTATPNPSIVSTVSSKTMSAASLSISDITGISLLGAVDGTGIGVSTSQDWLEASLSGSTLSVTANSYNHTKADRSGIVYLKATGANTKEITITQKPTIVPSPTLTATPADKSFTVSWTPHEKAGSYVAYYSTSSELADPAASGTALTIDDSGETYTAAPSVSLSNGTTYYIYVRVNTVEAGSASVYGAPSDNWATTSVTPSAAPTVSYIWNLATGDLGSTGSPSSSVSKGTLSSTSSTMTWNAAYTWGSDSATKSFNWDGTYSRGVQIGTGSATNKCATMTLSTTGFSATVTKIVIGANTASSGNATLSVSVGGTAFKVGSNSSVSLNTTTTPTTYTFTGSATGTIEISISNSAAKALYLKSIKINTD